ncbi:MAG: hypothetical protein AAGD14_00955 [Planctomycetota bacterium]
MQRSVIGIGLLLVFCLPAEAGTHKDERWGFKIRVPKGWKSAAMSASEEWIAAKFIGKRELQAKRGDWYVSEHPQIWVIGFPHARQKERGAKVEDKDGKLTVSFKNPYKDYKDFVKRESWFVGGGYHFSVEEETEIGGHKVTMYEIKVEKLTSSPFRIVTWVHHFDDVDFAVQCKILEDHYKSFRKTFRGTLRSLDRIDRKKALPTGATTGDQIVIGEDESKMTPEERRKARKDRFNRTLRKEVDALPKGWYEQRSKHYVALANADRKFTKRALAHAEAVRSYLDKTFGDIGDDYVPMGIMRVFATREEESAFAGGTRWTWGYGAEQVLVTQTVGGTDRNWEFEYLSARLTAQFLSFKNRHLSENMPYWFREGLKQHMRFARSKRGRVKIQPDEYDRQAMKDIIKEGKAIPLREMFEKGRAQDMTQYQVGSVCSFLLSKGDRGKTKKAVQRYLANLIEVIEEQEVAYEKERARIEEEAKKAAEADMGGPVEESEDEEGEEDEGPSDAEKQFEKLQEAMKTKRDAILAEAFKRTFGSLSDKDWKRLHAQWVKYAS